MASIFYIHENEKVCWILLMSTELWKTTDVEKKKTKDERLSGYSSGEISQQELASKERTLKLY